MNKFEITKVADKKYLLTMIQEDENGDLISNGLSFDRSELRSLYIKLRDIFSVNEK
jgi:hypothetical protein